MRVCVLIARCARPSVAVEGGTTCRPIVCIERVKRAWRVTVLAHYEWRMSELPAAGLLPVVALPCPLWERLLGLFSCVYCLRHSLLHACVSYVCLFKPKFNLACHVSTRQTRHVRRVELMHFGCVKLVEQHGSTRSSRLAFRLRNGLCCVGWGVKLYSLTRLARHVERVTWRTQWNLGFTVIELYLSRCCPLSFIASSLRTLFLFRVSYRPCSLFSLQCGLFVNSFINLKTNTYTCSVYHFHIAFDLKITYICSVGTCVFT